MKAQTNSRRNFLAATGGTLAATPFTFAEESNSKVKRIYIAADDHTDYMWTGDEKQYRDAFLKTLDHYLDLADQTDDRSSDFQSRWNCDGLLWFIEYQRHRSADQLERLVGRIKSGHISVPMNMLVSCYGGMPTEAVLRSMYPAGHIARKHDLEIPIAVAMENQTLPLGLGMLWAGCGIKYSWKGICACASKVKNSGGNREHDVYWWTGIDGSRILMKWYSLAAPLRRGVYGNQGPGGYAEARFPSLAIEYVDTDNGFKAKNPQNVIGLFGQGWDDLQTAVPLDDLQRSFPAIAESKSNSSRRVIVSNELDYFEDFESSYGDEVPGVSLAYGNEWDLYSASMSEVSASVRRATERLRTLEGLAAYIAMDDPKFDSTIETEKQQAWIALGMYWEHDWTADGPVSRDRRAAWQRKIAAQITGYVDKLDELVRLKISNAISSDDASEALSVIAFNPLGWQRSDVVELVLPDTMRDKSVGPFPVGKDRAIPSQTETRGNQTVLRFIATNIPPLGFQAYQIRELEQTVDAKPMIRLRGNSLAGLRQSLKINEDGSISAWQTGTSKWIDANQVANQLEPAKGKIRLASVGPVSSTVEIDVARPIRRRTRITMYESIQRIEIDNQIQENFSDVESWKFEFALDTPVVSHEEVGAILRADFAKNDGDYADKNARTDWLTLNHFVKFDDGDQSVVLSSRDCQFFHLGEDPLGPMRPDSSTLHVLAGGQVDGKKLGIPKQGGDRDFTQRFSLDAGESLSGTEAMKRSMEFANPIEAVKVAGIIDEEKLFRPLFDFESDHAIVWTVKPSEQDSGGGTIVRVWNLSDESTTFQLTPADQDAKIKQASHIETDLPGETDPIRPLKPGEIRTLRIV